MIAAVRCLRIARRSPRPSLHAEAWSESGNHLVALLAFDELTSEEQQKLLAILAAHPRYAEDFTPPVKIESVDRFRIGTAGYWLDIARRLPEYNRPSWHYQLGATLTLGNEAELNIPETPGDVPPDATLATQDLYNAQAIELCRRTFDGRAASPSDRAIALCWIAHLVGDAHPAVPRRQPLRCWSIPRWRPWGQLDPDTAEEQHARPLGRAARRRYSEGTLDRSMKEIGAPEYSAAGEAALRTPGFLDPLVWLAESRAAAVDHAYTHEVLGAVKATMKEGGELPEIYFSETCLKQAGKLAQLRAAAAGKLLAAIWREGIK